MPYTKQSIYYRTRKIGKINAALFNKLPQNQEEIIKTARVSLIYTHIPVNSLGNCIRKCLSRIINGHLKSIFYFCWSIRKLWTHYTDDFNNRIHVQQCLTPSRASIIAHDTSAKSMQQYSINYHKIRKKSSKQSGCH